ncbi:salivary glue protein Sgs-3-like isoform X3 [Halichondria panicea]|uniref:salivary glue protein Sgs-3-like isoform X3 n=1 Tax=Halichondria panicea TaxID=6063 RepID=UPI00312B3FA1
MEFKTLTLILLFLCAGKGLGQTNTSNSTTGAPTTQVPTTTIPSTTETTTTVPTTIEPAATEPPATTGPATNVTELATNVTELATTGPATTVPEPPATTGPATTVNVTELATIVTELATTGPTTTVTELATTVTELATTVTATTVTELATTGPATTVTELATTGPATTEPAGGSGRPSQEFVVAMSIIGTFLVVFLLLICGLSLILYIICKRRVSRLKDEVVWVDTEHCEQSCNVVLTDVKETPATPTSPVKEGKNESDAALTACTFGFEGEIVKSEEMSMSKFNEEV